MQASSAVLDKIVSGKDKVVGAVKGMNMNKIGLDNASFFESTSTAKLEDVKKLLDSDSDREKMEGMKRLIAMISKGRDASSLFPAVVKNVISKNVELKKLVYMYLVHYAELEPDSSLLAINTFQKDLGNSNQFIRASALRVMSSIRVKIIMQLIVLAIEKCMKDSSPYVRKGAAHAVTKVFNVDREHQEQLTSIIAILLADRSTLVLGSAVAAFVEVCPDRFDLIHPHFRKLCHLLADIDEWGQITIINMLIRYGRNQFADPTKEKQKEPKPKKEARLKIAENSSESEEEESAEESDDDEYVTLDPDHRLLLDSALPLLKSRNAGVVLAVASLYHYLAPPYEAQKVAKAIVRLVRSKKEIQYIVLTNIATMAANDPAMFEPFVSDFFVHPSDPVYSRTLKLEIITLLVNENNINKVLKELKNYVGREEKEFVTAAIQAIGRCASQVPEITDRCLHGLMSLITNKSDAVVAESVVVIKKLLQMISEKDEEQQEMKDIILHLARLLETITAPRARASIVWVIGEYSHKVPKVAPDILRQLAKSFVNEDSSVKLQTLNLGSKLSISNPQQTIKIYEHILNMARFDTSYDVRDRCRLFRRILEAPTLKERSAQLLMNKKPIPTSGTQINNRKRFTLGTLSHLLCQTVAGYQPLDDFPEVPPSGETRNEVVEVKQTKKGTKISSKNPKDWLDDESSEGYTTSEGSEGEEGEDSEGYSEGYSSEGSEEEGEESEESEDDGWPKQPPPKKAPAKPVPAKEASKPQQTKAAPKAAAPAPKKDTIEDLFSFDTPSEAAPPTIKPKAGGLSLDELFGAPPKATNGNGTVSASSYYSLGFAEEEKKETLLKHHLGGGLGVEYSFSRSPSMHGSTFVGVNLTFKNHSEKILNNIKIGKVTHSGEFIPFSEIPSIHPGTTVDAQVSIKFTSVSQTVKFEICTDRGTFNVSLEPSIVALVRSVTMSPDEYAVAEKKLTGMNEASDLVFFRDVAADTSALPQKVMKFCSLSPVTIDNTGGKYTFAGRTQIEDAPILFCVNVLDRDSGKAKISVSSENTVLNSRLLKALQKEIQ